MVLIIAGCLVVSALTLLYPSTPTYDPWAWILWGREIAHLDLVTEGGPSWKPFPILFTVPFSFFGQDLAPYLWLWLARAGGLLGCVMAYRMAYRLSGGRVYGALAGISAFAALLSSNKYVRDAALGNSEPILAAVVLWAFERHLDGRRDHALYLGVAAALLRPEAWPFLALYGLWLWVYEPQLRLRLVAFAALVPALWILPEWWGADEPFRAGSRANAPNPGSAAFAAHPAFELFKRFAESTVAPVEAGTIVAVGVAAIAWVRRRAQGPVLALAALGFSWFALVAVMTEAGYAGNQRYLIVSSAAFTILAGVGVAFTLQGAGTLAERLTGRDWGRPVAVALAFAVILAAGVRLEADTGTSFVRKLQRSMRYESSLWPNLERVIAAAGGKERLKACGGLYSGPYQTQMVAYELGVHGSDVRSLEGTPPPGAAFRTRTLPRGPLVIMLTDPRRRYRQIARVENWRVLTVPPIGSRDCPAAGADAPRAPAGGRVSAG